MQSGGEIFMNVEVDPYTSVGISMVEWGALCKCMIITNVPHTQYFFCSQNEKDVSIGTILIFKKWKTQPQVKKLLLNRNKLKAMF